MNYIYSVVTTIKDLIDKETIPVKWKSFETIQKQKINKINTLMMSNKWIQLKRILHVKGNDQKRIKIKSIEKIHYYNYLIRTRKLEVETSQKCFKRVNINKLMLRYGKRQQEMTQSPSEHPSVQMTTLFWKNIYENIIDIDYNELLINDVINCDNYNYDFIEFNMEDLEYAIHGMKNWKAPGPDMLQGYWIKYLLRIKNYLLKMFNEWFDNPVSIPENLLKGRTVLLFKDGEPSDPKNYRPITCLSCLTKLFTTMLKTKIEESLSNNETKQQLNSCQLGCKKYSYASKEGLLMTTLTQSFLNRTNRKWVEMYYDIAKAYDSINHEWMLTCLRYYNIPESIISIIKHMSDKWALKLHYGNEFIGDIEVKTGILQGDSFSPLLFTLCIDCISKNIDKYIEPFVVKNKEDDIEYSFNHIFYMDDLKVITSNLKQMKCVDSIIRKTFKAIGLKVNDKKCGIMWKGKFEVPDELKDIPIVDDSNPYKYLGVELGSKVNIIKYCERVIKNIEQVIKNIVEKESSNINIIRIINSDVISILRYGFSIVPWKMGQLEQIDLKIRKALYSSGSYSKMLPKSRLYVPIDQFGIGLMNVRDECSKELIRVFLKFIWNSDSNISELIKLTNKNPEGILKRLKKSLGKKLNIDTVLNWISNNESIKNVLKVMELFEQHLSKLYFDNWKSKKSSIFAQHINDKNIDIEVSSKAWKSINIKRNAFIQTIKM